MNLLSWPIASWRLHLLRPLLPPTPLLSSLIKCQSLPAGWKTYPHRCRKPSTHFAVPDQGVLDHTNSEDHTPLPQMTSFAGITGNMETKPRNACHPAKSRETVRPVASGDERSWPTNKSPAIFKGCYYQPLISH